MEQLSRKKNLCRNLNAMRCAFPDDYDIYPQSWCWPEQSASVRRYMTEEVAAGHRPTLIMKPDGRCQGRGIFLTRKVNLIDQNESQVCQVYMPSPYLINGLKFDLRLYAILASVDPLRIYLYHDGLVRFCTEPYRHPTTENISHVFMHLTNYAINKASTQFEFNEDADVSGHGSKWTFCSFIEWLKGNDKESDSTMLWTRIQDVVVKTVIAASSNLRHQYRVRFPADEDGAITFQLLGLDIMLDSNLKPYIVEVNRNPSLRCDTPLDSQVKGAMLKDLFSIVRPTPCQPSQRQTNLTGNERQLNRAIKVGQRRDLELERSKSTGFQRIFPLDTEIGSEDPNAGYVKFIEYANYKFTSTSIQRQGTNRREP
eukprot:CRZ05106.1 hypothetical protein [Spongospora subterranea]